MTKLTPEQIKDGREIITLGLKNALSRKDHKKLEGLAEIADKYGVNKTLRHRAWKLLGTHWMGEGHFVEAAIALNSARQADPLKMDTVKLLIQCLGGFVNDYRETFSSSDLSKIEDELDRILNFYKVKNLWRHPATNVGKELLHDVVQLKVSAKESTETPATHKTDRIVNALHTNVSMDEVRADFARLITPYLLERIAEEQKEGNKGAKKKRKKKHDNKPDEDNAKE
jgi:hypothetical protein